jgi:hypothetical protein
MREPIEQSFLGPEDLGLELFQASKQFFHGEIISVFPLGGSR